jgi:ABC-2 type transport system permease protein
VRRDLSICNVESHEKDSRPLPFNLDEDSAIRHSVIPSFDHSVIPTMPLLRAWLTLVWLSFRRLLWSTTTYMVLFPLVGAGLYLLFMRRWLPARTEVELAKSFVLFTNGFVLAVFFTFLLPICSLAYATTSLGGDREDRTLVFLLCRPVPRWLILLAKLCATLPLVLGLVAGSFWIYCRLAGPVGRAAFPQQLPSVFYMTLAYVGLFHLFAVMFRYSTILALIYSLFAEPLVSNMPGIINRVAVTYYGRVMVDAAGGMTSNLFAPVRPVVAVWVLCSVALLALLLAGWVFQRKEYRDLT